MWKYIVLNNWKSHPLSSNSWTLKIFGKNKFVSPQKMKGTSAAVPPWLANAPFPAWLVCSRTAPRKTTMMSHSLAYRRRQYINGQHGGCTILSFSFSLCGGYCTPEPSAKEILACLHQKIHFPSGSQSSEGLLILCAATVTFQLINVYQETPSVLCFCIAEQIPDDLCICTQR